MGWRECLRRLAAIAVAAVWLGGAAQAGAVALTFDDLPGLSLDDSTPYLRVTNARLVRGLRRARLPATGFVIGDKLEDPDHARLAMVEAWANAGFILGNHTYSHGSLNKTPVGAYIADVARDDAVLRPLLAAHGQAPVWFRHPYLETGATLADKRTFEAWLAAHGYRVAPVTMENSDWMFALPYDEAVAHHDRKAARRIRREYLDYTARVTAWYRKAALALLGREPAFIYLLHDTRLNADVLGDLLKVMRKNGLRPVSLAEAMTDRAYRISDDQADPNGDEWLSRWSETLHKELPWDDFPEPPADIAAANDRLDKEP